METQENQKFIFSKYFVIFISIAYLVVLGYFLFNFIIPSADPNAGFGVMIMMLIFLPLSSIAFGVLIKFANCDRAYKKQASYLVAGIFVLAYLFVRIGLPYASNYNALSFGILDIILFFCGFMLIIPAL